MVRFEKERGKREDEREREGSKREKEERVTHTVPPASDWG